MEKIILDKKGIHEYQQNRAHYLMIDLILLIFPFQQFQVFEKMILDLNLKSRYRQLN